MNAERRKLVEEAFIEAAALAPGEREAAVVARCGGDAEAVAEVLSLLGHHAPEEEGFLDHAELEGLGADEWTLPAGTRIAGFTIGRILGTGGMGVVYVAEQDRPRRTVALKVIRLGRRGMLRRFEHEAEVLGRLQHPGIAQVYEAGTADLTAAGGPPAQPYIAMELVQGYPLDEYARRESLGVRSRLELVAKVCDAAQHAHQRSVIHRDLKPANILVDESGRPRVLDFGVARAAGADARETRQTGAGQLIGTLAYMSPEQVLGDPSEVDTRTDVYALGVILYQLLAGQLPHRLDGRALPEAARVIREEEPTRVGILDRTLRGDIETIVTKALAKDRARRYQSAIELGQDIRRYLEGKPIAAKDDSALYVLGKQLKRHRTLVAAGLGFILLLAWFAVYATIQSGRNAALATSEANAKIEALNALRAAKDARQLADSTSERLRSELATSTVERGRLLAHAGNLPAAEALLWPAHLRDPSSRQSRWALWELYSQEPCMATVPAHTGSVVGMGFSADERVIYTAGADGIIRMWDRATLLPTQQFSGSAGVVVDMVVSPDASLIATASADGRITLWDTSTRAERRRISAHTGPARGLAFSPDGARLVSCGNDRLVRLWDVASGAHLGDLAGGNPKIAFSRATWSRDGRWIACGLANGDGRVLLWDVATPDIKGPTEVSSHAGGVQSLAISSDGRLLATGGNDRVIRLWDLTKGQPAGTLSAPNGSVLTLRFTASDRSLISTGWWTIDAWDLSSSRRTRSLSLRTSAGALAVSRNGDLMAAGLQDGTAQFWDANPSAGKLWLAGHTGRVAAVFSPDARLAVTGDGQGVIRIWDSSTGEPLARFPAHTGRVRSLRFSPDGRLLATGGEDGSVHLWDMRSGTRLASLSRMSMVSDDSLRFSPDGRVLAAARATSVVTLFRVPDLADVGHMASVGAEVVSLRFSPDGQELAAASRDHIVRLWPLSGEEPRLFTPTPEITPWSIAWSPDGSRLLVGDWAREIEVWDPRAGKEIGKLRGHRGLVSSVEFDPADPVVAASAAADGTVRLWDTSTHLGLATLDCFEGWEALSLCFSPDGRRLLCSSATGGAVIWDLTYFNRHIAWNTESQIRRLMEEDDGRAAYRPDEARAWAAQVLSAAQPVAGEDPLCPGPQAVREWALR